MRAAEALRLGSLIVKPAAFAEWFPDGSGCAKGMVLEAVGKRIKMNCEMAKSLRSPNNVPLLQTFPWMENKTVWPCECFYRNPTDTISGVIQHLFDSHVMHFGVGTPWTIDRLCEWLDSVDPTPRTEPAGNEIRSVQSAVEVVR